MTSPFLELSGICKRFPGVVALDCVGLDVHPGEVVGLIGENGAGKSTLMKILGGIYHADKGAIAIKGRDVTIRRVGEAIALGIGFIHQELNVLDNLDVAANVFLGREPVWAGPLRLVDRGRIYRQTRQLLQDLGLDIPSRTPLGELSIAHRQMVEIAKALSLQARILIMDEPTSCLTLAETERLLQVVRELRSQGVSIIYITHRLGEIRRCADRVFALRDGRNTGMLAGREITHDNMVRLMIGRELNDYYDGGRSGRTLAAPCETAALSGAAEGEGTRAAAGDWAALRVRNLRTRAFPAHSVSFDVARGEIVGFAGLVGAGRSEVAQAIFGVDEALEGKVVLDGRELAVRSPRDAIDNGMYLVPEDRRNCGLIMEMTVVENMTLPALWRYTLAGLINRDAERSVAQRQCQVLGVKTPSIHTPVLNLSGGNQQKVVLGKWLSMRPRVMIFDEPTRGIDVGAKAEIYRLIRQLAAAGVAIMMISSEMEEILGVSDRVVVMHEGAVTGILPRGECSEEVIMHLAVGHTTRAA